MPIVMCKGLEFKWGVLLSIALKVGGSVCCIWLAQVVVGEYKKYWY
jgi:hypothetical protein